MPRGGKRPGAGRPNGAKARKTICVQSKLEKLGCDPFEGMFEVAQQAKLDGDNKLYFDVMRELAKYVSPTLKAVEHSGDPEAPLVLKKVELIAPSIDEQPKD